MNRFTLPVVVVGTASLLVAQSASAALLYNFDASDGYVTADRPLRNAGGTDYTVGDGRAFSTDAMQPGSGYTGPVFSGGFYMQTNAVNVDIATAVIKNNSNGGDPIQMVLGSTNNASAFNALVLTDVTASVLDATSSVRLRAIRTDAQGVPVASARLVFGSGGSFYASTSTILSLPKSNEAMGDVTLNFAGLDALSFNTYDPTSSLAYGGAASTFDPTTSSWDYVGVLINYTNTGTNRSNLGIQLHQLTVNATPIPEPVSLALLGVGGMLLISRRRR